MVRPLLIPCFTPSSVSLSGDSDIAEIHRILFVELRPAATSRQTPRIHPRGPTTSTALTSHPAQFLHSVVQNGALHNLPVASMTRMTTQTTRARPTQTPNIHRTPSHLAQFLGVSSRQPADYVLHKHNVEQNGTPHNSPIASMTGMTTLTTCEDDPHPLLASQRLSGVKPTSHEAPAGDLTPRRRRRSTRAQMYEEGIRKRLQTCCPAERRTRLPGCFVCEGEEAKAEVCCIRIVMAPRPVQDVYILHPLQTDYRTFAVSSISNK
ncbi:hypothetical protein DFH09DRAFT_1087501 [Mycena vulgaris]|nr:hypothetical protein DFH09DRAFT_1087501 [Mycena vulgaris]